ncbi:hypothetical protein DXG01_004141 [Tephrocybe rancida]|nr:hypothetical protein DXG01_004141 [Tephrocybe rancida]
MGSRTLTKSLAKRGEDGLTKYQCYYRKHPEIKEKNKEHERQKREALRKEQEESKKLKQASVLESDVVKLHVWVPKQVASSLPVSGNSQPSMNAFFPNFFPWIDPAFLVKMDDPNSMTRPPDFFTMMPSLWEKEYAATIDRVVGPIKKIARPQMFDELEQLYRIRENVINWSSGWSGAANWNSTHDRSFIMAVENNRVDHWREQVYSHATAGHSLLAQLQIMDHWLPAKHWKVRELWRMRLELAEVLIWGITILEIKTSVLPGLCTMRYTDMESTKESDNTDMESAQESDDKGGHKTEVNEEGSVYDDMGGRGLTLRDMEIEGDMWDTSGEEYFDSNDKDMQSQ